MAIERCGFMHMAMTRGYLIRAIREHGHELVLPQFKTDEEAIAAIEASGQEYFVPESCDNQTEDGRCAGHRTFK